MGPSKTGKSVLQNIALAFVGKENVVVTSLKWLNTDPLETTHLIGRELAVIYDTERYRRDLSKLKSITGRDRVVGHTKFIQGSISFPIKHTC